MTTGSTGITRFLSEIVRLSLQQDYFPFPVVAIATADDEIAIIFYREVEGGSLYGRQFHYDSLAREFEGSTPEAIADAIVVNELVDPSGPGLVRNYPWERDITETNEPVQWISEPMPPFHSLTAFTPEGKS